MHIGVNRIANVPCSKFEKRWFSRLDVGRGDIERLGKNYNRFPMNGSKTPAFINIIEVNIFLSFILYSTQFWRGNSNTNTCTKFTEHTKCTRTHTQPTHKNRHRQRRQAAGLTCVENGPIHTFEPQHRICEFIDTILHRHTAASSKLSHTCLTSPKHIHIRGPCVSEYRIRCQCTYVLVALDPTLVLYRLVYQLKYALTLYTHARRLPLFLCWKIYFFECPYE